MRARPNTNRWICSGIDFKFINFRRCAEGSKEVGTLPLDPFPNLPSKSTLFLSALTSFVHRNDEYLIFWPNILCQINRLFRHFACSKRRHIPTRDRVPLIGTTIDREFKRIGGPINVRIVLFEPRSSKNEVKMLQGEGVCRNFLARHGACLEVESCKSRTNLSRTHPCHRPDTRPSSLEISP